MSKQNRKNATGTVIDNKTIRVNFPGDREYTGTLVSLNRINWGGNNNWDRDNPIFRPTDFNGFWAGGLKITVTGKSVRNTEEITLHFLLIRHWLQRLLSFKIPKH